MGKAPQRIIELAKLVQPVREEVIGLLCNRYIFRTHQEIVRRNKRLQGTPRGKFCDWIQVIYGIAASVGIRKLASETYRPDDVSLKRFLDDAIANPVDLLPCFERNFPSETYKAKAPSHDRQGVVEAEVCRRLIGADRSFLLRSCTKAIEFASKRAAHTNPAVLVRTKVRNVDQAIDAIREITEKYILLLYDRPRNLLTEMRNRKLPQGWDLVFLERWAKKETLALPLGEMEPPAK